MTNAVAFPLRLDGTGSAAPTPSLLVTAEQLIEELLFTSLGERLNRPDLGCGLLELVFEPSTDALRATTQFQVTSELQRWLGDVIRIVSVVVESRGSQIAVTVVFTLAPGGSPRTAVYVR